MKELPYFRALLRSVESRLYEGIELPRPRLDLGCGDGHFAAIALGGDIDVGVDPARASLKEAAARGTYRHLLQAGGGRIPLRAASMASGFSNSVLEHIPDVEQVLAEVARVLRPGAPWAFTVPNPAYLSELSLGKGWIARAIPGWADAYRSWFRKMSRVAHLESEGAWTKWLDRAGFEEIRTFRYFSPQALRVLERGHFLGLPSLLVRWVTGRWILVPSRLNLRLTETLLRRYDDGSAIADGTFCFYFARKRRSS